MTMGLINVNLITLFKMTKLFLKKMIERDYGRIMNIGSTGAFMPCPLNAVYVATKAFVLHMSEGISEELAKTNNVSVSTLCPGATVTEFANKANLEKSLLFRFFTMKASVVAQIGFEGMMKKKRIIIPGLYNKMISFSYRLFPRALITKIGMQLMKSY